MENKNVGYLLLGVCFVLVLIIFMYNSTLEEIVATSCTAVGHGDSCPMYDTIDKQTNLSLVIVGILAIVALVLIFSKPDKEVVIKKVEAKKKKKSYDLSNLKKEEKEVFELVKSKMAIFQADLIDKTGFGKAKMTRIIDRLEGNGFVERKRRGMTNIVVLKE
tara:strand:+ start:280 stop:765 length:486 start_codon:yes stop_codon:yes gene_type:complete